MRWSEPEVNTTTVADTWTGRPTPPESCPEVADVVIIGGGIVGVSTAWFLARQGVSVALCEKGFIAGEQSGRNWGWVRIQGRDPREVPMAIESLRIWRTLAEDIGEDVGFTEGGCLYTARNEKQLASLEQWRDIAHDFGLPTRLISEKEIATQVGEAASQWVGGLFTSTDGRAEPHQAGPAIGRAAVRAGATLMTSCAVRGIETEGGRVSAVVTEHGTIRSSTVLCAAGAWSRRFCASLDIPLPQLQVRGTVVRTAAAESPLQGNVFDERLGIRRRQDGGFTVAHGTILDHSITPSTFRYAFKFLPALRQEIGGLRLSIGTDFIDELRAPRKWALDRKSPFEEQRVLNPDPNPRVLDGIRKNLARTFPDLAGVEFVEAWAGMVETSPDVVPIICDQPQLPGFFIATGFSGHGFGLGPGAGKAIAGMLTGNDTGIDLSAFKLSRFFDGSPIRPLSAI